MKNNKLINKIFHSLRSRIITLINNRKTPKLIYKLFFEKFSSKYIRNIKIINDFYRISYFFGDNNLYWHFPKNNRQRGSKCYRKGLKERGLELAKSYKIDCLKFEEGDIVLDCGANYGDLFLYLTYLNIDLNYYAFEPGIDEYKTLELNMKNINTSIKKQTYQLGLGDSNSIKDFYYSPVDGDSSIIEIDSFIKKVQIEVIKLEDFVKQKLSDKKIKLLKLEAEGAEPEVLKGSKEILKQVDYIAADLGPERGLNKNCTLTEVTNFLHEHNFVIHEFGYPRITALFRNKHSIK